ncbi:hypothetical protein D3C76_1137070 [compost metagenome]
MLGFVVFQIGDCHAPAVIRIALETAHFGADLQFKVVFFLQSAHQLTGDFAVVHVRTDLSARGGHFLIRVATFHHQRRPLFDLSMIFRIFHAAEQAALLECRIARAQEIDVIVAPHKAHVRNGVNERVRIVHHAAVDLM